MKQLLDLVRWLLLVPVYLLFEAFYAGWFLNLFGREHGTRFWHLHFDFILFLASMVNSGGVCLLCAWIAPCFKRSVLLVAVVASITLTLRRESLILASQGLTRSIGGEITSEVLGGVIALLMLSLFRPRAKGDGRLIQAGR